MTKYRTNQYRIWDDDRKILYEYKYIHDYQPEPEDQLVAIFENGDETIISVGCDAKKIFIKMVEKECLDYR